MIIICTLYHVGGLSPFHLAYFLRFCLLSFGKYSSVLFFLTFCVCFFLLGRTDTSPKLKEMVWCMLTLCVDCVCLVTLAGWLELWPAWVVGPGALHALVCSGRLAAAEVCMGWDGPETLLLEGALAGSWSWSGYKIVVCWGSTCRECPGRTVEAEVGTR